MEMPCSLGNQEQVVVSLKFIRSFNEYLSNASCELGTVRDARDIAINKTKSLPSQSLHSSGVSQEASKEIDKIGHVAIWERQDRTRGMGCWQGRRCYFIQIHQ